MLTCRIEYFKYGLINSERLWANHFVIVIEVGASFRLQYKGNGIVDTQKINR